MKNKLCLITGANAGIGKATAIGLASQGASLLLVTRNAEKGNAAKAEIIAATKNDKVEVLCADLSSQKSISQLVENIKARYSKLDVLVNNAAYFVDTLQYSEDNIEMQWAVNHLAYFKLSNNLLPLLKEASSARIVNVASNAHKRFQINFDDLYGTKKYNGVLAYAQSKLANILFTYSLAKQLAGTNVTANALHPGGVKTDIGSKNTTGWIGKVWNLATSLPIVTVSVEKGAETSIYLASSPAVEGVSGKYFIKCKPSASSAESYKTDVAQKLWTISEQQIIH